MRGIICLLGVGLAASQGTFTVAAVGTTAYTFNGIATNNPTLYLQKGQTYNFVVAASGHPFRIIGDTTAASLQATYTTFADCTSCVTGDDTAVGTVTFTVPVNPTATRVGYRCKLHFRMIGSIVFVDPPAPISVVSVGLSGYSFDGGPTNPTLSLQKGLTYTFNVNAGGHPFRIIGDRTAASLQASCNSLAECGSCVTGGDATSGAVTFAVPTNPTAANVGYRCTLHAQMAGSISFIEPSPSASLTPTQTPTPSVSSSLTASPSTTSSQLATASPSQAPTPSPSQASTPTQTLSTGASASGTATQAATPSQAASPTPSQGGTPSQAPSASPSQTGVVVGSGTASQTPTQLGLTALQSASPGVSSAYPFVADLSGSMSLKVCASWRCSLLCRPSDVPFSRGSGARTRRPFLCVVYSGGDNWFAVGVSSSTGMIGGDVVVCRGPGNALGQYVLSSHTEGGVVSVGQPSITNATVYRGPGGIYAEFTRPYAAGPYSGAVGIARGSDANNLIFAAGRGFGLSEHALSDAGMGRISFESGTYSATGGATALNKAHGSLMFIAWTLFPLGILLARFTRHVEPSAGPNARWFLLHRITQSAGAVLLVIAFGIGIASVLSPRHFATAHGALGLAVVICVFLQIGWAVLRPHKEGQGESPTTLRRGWVICHRFTGAAVVVMAFVNVFLGFKRLDLHFGYYVAYALWIALFAVAAVVLELSCRRSSSPADLSKPPPSEDPSPALPTAPPSFNGANPMISKPYDASYA